MKNQKMENGKWSLKNWLYCGLGPGLGYWPKSLGPFLGLSYLGALDVIISSSWGVIVAEHRRVMLVDEALTVRGIDHFIPLEEKLQVIRGRHVREFQPFLGNYILIAISAAWSSLLSVRGVAGMLLNEIGIPAQVLPSEMERMRAMCDGNIVRASSQKIKNGFEYGERVTLESGPFAFHVGRYDRKTRRGDAALFFMFGREQRVLFKAGELKAA